MKTLKEAKEICEDRLAHIRFGCRMMRDHIMITMEESGNLELASIVRDYWDKQWGDDEGTLGGKARLVSYAGPSLVIEDSKTGELLDKETFSALELELIASPCFYIVDENKEKKWLSSRQTMS